MMKLFSMSFGVDIIPNKVIDFKKDNECDELLDIRAIRRNMLEIIS